MPLRTADKIFVSKNGKNCLKPAAILFIMEILLMRDGNIIDEVLVIVMRAPNTYTREDVVGV